MTRRSTELPYDGISCGGESSGTNLLHAIGLGIDLSYYGDSKGFGSYATETFVYRHV